jgi:hypothetical protein
MNTGGNVAICATINRPRVFHPGWQKQNTRAREAEPRLEALSFDNAESKRKQSKSNAPKLCYALRSYALDPTSCLPT